MSAGQARAHAVLAGQAGQAASGAVRGARVWHAGRRTMRKREYCDWRCQPGKLRLSGRPRF